MAATLLTKQVRGGAIGFAECVSQCDRLLDVTVTDTAGNEVEGEVRSDRWASGNTQLTWVPASDTSDAARQQEEDASEPTTRDAPAGCQLADGDHVGTLSTALILLALAASGRRRCAKREKLPPVNKTLHGLWFALVAASTSQAHALVLSDVITAVSPRIPAGGVIVIEGQCSIDPCTWPRNFEVRDEGGAVVAGHFERHAAVAGEWGMFIPDIPFEVGRKLRVLQTGDFASDNVAPHEVEVVQAPAFDPSTVSATLRYQRLAMPSFRCCPDAGVLSGAESCFKTGDRLILSVLADLNLTEGVASSQYAIDLDVYPAGMPEKVFALRRSSEPEQYAEEESADSAYCYRLRAVPMRGTEVVELATRCEPNPYSDIGPRPRLTAAEIDARLATCGADPVDAAVADDAGREVVREDAGVVAEARDDGCQLTNGGVNGGLWLALLLRRRRRV